MFLCDVTDKLMYVTLLFCEQSEQTYKLALMLDVFVYS